MKFPHLFLVVLILLATAIGASAFASQQCQIVSVEAPAGEINEGIPVVFTANLNAVVPTAKPAFKWTISAGTIMEGDGTGRITVETAGLGGQDVTATLEVSGISTACATVVSKTVSIVPGPACGKPLDEYGDIKFNDENARLYKFGIQLFNEESTTGYVLAYAAKPGEAAKRLLRAKNYLVKVRKMNPARIVTIDGGYKDELVVTLIIAPEGAAPPVAMPSIPEQN